MPASSPLPFTETEILDRLRACAVEALELPPGEMPALTADLPLVEGLRLDSLRQVVLLARIEEEYGFEFDPADLSALGADGTLRDLVRVIQRRAPRVGT
jgi:acyl carrier protein